MIPDLLARLRLPAALALLAMLLNLTVVNAADDATIARALSAMSGELDQAAAALQAGDVAKARAEFKEFDEDWDKIEDDVRARSRDAYRSIEEAMADVSAALVKADPPDKAKAATGLATLTQRVQAFVGTLGAASGATPAASAGTTAPRAAALPRTGDPSPLFLLIAGIGVAAVGWRLRPVSRQA